MSCITCEVTPPAEKTSPDRVGEHHIGQRFGDGGLGLAVLFRGYDVTLQTVEALAGDETTGWVEMRIVTSDGTPTLHPGAEDGGYGPHVVTVIRRGTVQIVRGAELISGPPEPRTEITALGESTPSYLPTG